MASSQETALVQPMPLKSTDSPALDLRHPTPDLQSLQGAYVGNIERLEEHAERLSSRGSDIAEEIRKLNVEQKLSDSRRSSLRSIQTEEPRALNNVRSRNASTSSYTNSIVDVNGAARWGGYSPAGYVTSPVGSLRSGSFTHQAPSLARQRSGSRTSRLGQITYHDDEEPSRISEEQPMSPDSPQSVRSLPKNASSPPPPSHRSVSSFTRKYEQIANEIQEEFHSGSMGAVGEGAEHRGEPEQHEQHEQHDEERYPNPHDTPDRPPTAASTDTYHQARTLWQDFDGVHTVDTVPEEDITPSHGSGSRHSRQSSLLRAAPELPPQGQPPPEEGMVFYPAPVPQMLNLPKRLSQMPTANIQARRRTQLLDHMQTDNRKSAPWLSEAGVVEATKQNRKSRLSMGNMAKLPPQLRASAYFDQSVPAQEYEVKGESAEDTLNSILEASAHAPVSAFTDHPYAGTLGSEVYGKGHDRSKSKTNLAEAGELRKRRSSLNLLDIHHNSNGDVVNKLKKRNSTDLNVLTTRDASSRLSFADDLDISHHDNQGRESEQDETPTGHSVSGDLEHEEHHDDEAVEEEDQEEEEEPQYFGPPTTLLAELQMRKAQQKTRNLTAATAFPNGMHSTLLELDAVAEIERKRRAHTKVNLAWEAPPGMGDQEDDSDDDVPLGMLFPNSKGLASKAGPTRQQQQSDWDRPLGLIAQRELEDNEPLSRRRTRLLGGNANRRTQVLDNVQDQEHLTVPMSSTPQPESDEEEGETLAQRMRRLKNRETLNGALDPEVRKSTVSGDFAADMMSQFGLPSDDNTKAGATAPASEDGEETLGQIRARLQAEAVARGDMNPLGARPPLRASHSLADILSANPVNPNNTVRKVSDEQFLAALPQGSLLAKNEVKQNRRTASRIDMNRRVSSYGNLDKPLLGDDVGKKAPEQAIGANIQAYKDKLYGDHPPPQTAPVRAPSMMFTPTMMGNGMMPSMPSMNFPGQRDSYFPQANTMSMMGPPMGMNPMMGGMGMGGMNPMMSGMGGMGMMPQQQMMGMNGMGGMGAMGMGMGYPYSGMGGMAGMRQSSMINLPQMGGMGGMGMQQPMEAPMNPQQRDMIDRWRQDVQH